MSRDERISDFDYIRLHVPETEMLAQLAEEAAELAQAALKLRRALDGANPTTVSVRQARRGLTEETADVNVCLRALGKSFVDDDGMEIFAEKRTRWRNRLEAARRDEPKKTCEP